MLAINEAVENTTFTNKVGIISLLHFSVGRCVPMDLALTQHLKLGDLFDVSICLLEETSPTQAIADVSQTHYFYVIAALS